MLAKNNTLYLTIAILLIAGSLFLQSRNDRKPAAANLPAPSTQCFRGIPGSEATQATDLYSQNGVLKTELTYISSEGPAGTQYCYVTPEGYQSPTLHLQPGDTLEITLKNRTAAPASSGETMKLQTNICGNSEYNASSTNIHFHGTNSSPRCHEDQVVSTLVNAGEDFTYHLKIPADETAGLYWYHPHVHGHAEDAVLGGATGAIVIEGLQKVQPAAAGLAQRILVVRDNLVPGNPTPGGAIPSWDLSLNNIPVPYPDFTPAKITMAEGSKELWSIVNTAADSILDIQLQYDGVVQPLQIVALDSVATGSQTGSHTAKMISKTHVLLAPASRVEFIVTAPTGSVKVAQLLTLNVDTGPAGDSDPQRPIAQIALSKQLAVALPVLNKDQEQRKKQRFTGLDKERPVLQRKLFFSEVISNPNDPSSQTNFFITPDGQIPKMFSMLDAPTISTKQGSVEEWTIENRATETHVFHIHQIHFLLLARDGVAVAPEDQQVLDTIPVPFWDGVVDEKGQPVHPYPSVKIRMDFRGPDVGDFVFHCHLLGHEDNGMMAIIHVNPK